MVSAAIAAKKVQQRAARARAGQQVFSLSLTTGGLPECGGVTISTSSPGLPRAKNVQNADIITVAQRVAGSFS